MMSMSIVQPKTQLASGYCYFDRLHFLTQGQDL
jgi:hypothetical protein